MSTQTLIYDPNAGGDVTANLNFEADGLTVFGPNGRKLQHWPYSEIVHAFPKDQRKDEYLAHVARPEIRLQVRLDAEYDAIAARAPQLRRRRWAAKLFWGVMHGLPQEAQFGIYVLGAIVIFTIYRLIAGLFE